MALTVAELLKSESLNSHFQTMLVAGDGIDLTWGNEGSVLTIAGAGNLDYGLITGSVTGTTDYGSLI